MAKENKFTLTLVLFGKSFELTEEQMAVIAKPFAIALNKTGKIPNDSASSSKFLTLLDKADLPVGLGPLERELFISMKAIRTSAGRLAMAQEYYDLLYADARVNFIHAYFSDEDSVLRMKRNVLASLCKVLKRLDLHPASLPNITSPQSEEIIYADVEELYKNFYAR